MVPFLQTMLWKRTNNLNLISLTEGVKKECCLQHSLSILIFFAPAIFSC